MMEGALLLERYGNGMLTWKCGVIIIIIIIIIIMGIRSGSASKDVSGDPFLPGVTLRDKQTVE